jgi:coproporphyrinogen III oxidase
MYTSFKTASVEFLTKLQEDICNALSASDGKADFSKDTWERTDETSAPGGGGLTRLLVNGGVIEQGGVNFSEVYGTLPREMAHKLIGSNRDEKFYATGVSLVIHPHSPKVPTTHANFRYLEVENHAWFGGGADLTPFVLEEDDAKHFHSVFKNACDKFSPDYYPQFKKQCDEYFLIPHRGETRGVGGIFYDYLGKSEPSKLEHYFEFMKSVAPAFIEAYLPIVEKRKHETFTEREKEFQLLRRGRYVEFNLVYDRGTQFGLHTKGRSESILMSLPPLVRWQYEGSLAVTDEEKKLEAVLREPREWV